MKNAQLYKSILSRLMLISIMSLGLFMMSCEDIIDLKPYESVSEATAFDSPSLCELSVMGMYNAAQVGYYSGTPQRGYPFGAAVIEQNDCRGEEAVNAQTFYRYTYLGTYTPTTANNVGYWISIYRLINRINIVIEGVRTAADNGIISAELAAEYEGEARLLRGMSYQELLFHFAYPYSHTADASHPGVPIHTTAYTSGSQVDDVLSKGRSSVADVYDLILEDYDYAEDNLPSSAERSGNWMITRGTSEAAIALKTRTYLHMYDMDNVILEGQKLVTSAIYSLTAEPDGPFGLSGYANTESIYSMENDVNSNPGVNAALASQYNRRLLVLISPIVWRNKFWLPDDKRREEGVMVFTVEGIKFTNKYTETVNMDDPCPLIRYAEVLLNMAEAYARKNDVINARDYLNQVRDRSLADPATQSYQATDFADNIELLEAILGERSIEFVMEGRRWPDIHRLQHCPYFPIDGIPAKVANAYPDGSLYTLGTEYDGPLEVPSYPYTDKRFLWPIPQVEIDANPILGDQQNPGW